MLEGQESNIYKIINKKFIIIRKRQKHIKHSIIKLIEKNTTKGEKKDIN